MLRTGCADSAPRAARGHEHPDSGRIDAIDERIDAIDERIDAIDERINGFDRGIDGIRNASMRPNTGR
jgi:archaellum component FlaC